MEYTRKNNLAFVVIGMATVMLFANINASAQKIKQISGTAMGTNQQLGQVISVDIRVNDYSTPEDKVALLGAFTEGGSEGLANALHKMSAKGRIAITGTLGFDVNYIRQFPQSDGSTLIRFVTDRPIAFGELWHSTRSMDYSLSMGEITLSKDKGKSSGTLMPIAKFKLNKEKELEIENYQNPWKLVNIKVWK